jgi:acetyl esterase/lipase
MRYGRGLAAVLGALLVCAAPAIADSVPPPTGPAPLRYRDAIFPTLTVTRGLAYGSAPDQSGNPVTLTLDMYRPAGDTQTSRPAIVLVHGGSFDTGDSRNTTMVTIAREFASRGYVAVSINYRQLNTSRENCGTESQPSQNCENAALAAQHDAQAAVRWLRRYALTYGVDPTRIAIEGASAGAATALEVAVSSGDPGDSGNPGYDSRVGAAISISGALPGSHAKSFYDRSDSPVLMFEGTADATVPYAAAAQTATEMRNAGIKVVFEALQGGGHVPMATFGDQIVTQSVYFAYDELALGPATKLSHLALSPRRFRASRRGPTVVGRGGMRIRYRNATASFVPVSTRFEVLRKTVGIRRGGRCVASHGTNRPRRCTRLVRVGSFSSVKTTLRFSGRLRGHALKPGAYVLRATPSVNGHPGRTATATFQIV